MIKLPLSEYSRGSAFAAALLLLVAAFPAPVWAEKREFNMTIDEVSIEVAPGFSNKVFAFNGQVPGPLIHVKEGDDVTVHVTNNTTLSHAPGCRGECGGSGVRPRRCRGKS